MTTDSNPARRSGSRAGPAVLVVDDDEQFRGYLGELLTEEGYRVVASGDGDEGARDYRRVQPSLVIANLMMPNKGGLALIGELRDADALVPILALTGHGGLLAERYLEAARLMGADRALRKPVGAEDLLAAVAGLLGHARPSA